MDNLTSILSIMSTLISQLDVELSCPAMEGSTRKAFPSSLKENSLQSIFGGLSNSMCFDYGGGLLSVHKINDGMPVDKRFTSPRQLRYSEVGRPRSAGESIGRRDCQWMRVLVCGTTSIGFTGAEIRRGFGLWSWRWRGTSPLSSTSFGDYGTSGHPSTSP